jgi:acetylornithine deacetylase/succinyl-diaminopimelate desuccinylase-like protein
MGFVQPDSHAHAPNEWMDLNNYETGIRRSRGAGTRFAAMER